MAVNFSPIGNGFQFLTTTGLPLNGGFIYTYQAGSSTPLTTYTSPSGLIANTNPIVLQVDGRPPQEIWFADGYNYKFVLADSNNVVIATYDNLYGIPTSTAVASPTVIPTGLISLWSGSIGSIPSGWLLCDGNNSTPDLRDRFIVGAGNNYAVAGQGGSTDAIVVAHTHTATSVVTESPHTHFVANTNFANPGTGVYGSPSITNSNYVSGGNYAQGQEEKYSLNGDSTVANAGLTNSVSTGLTVATTNTSTGTSGTNANLPPYYALAYIMKS